MFLLLREICKLFPFFSLSSLLILDTMFLFSARQSEEAQRKILAELDRWAEMQADLGDSDSSSN